jgi:hypothetical protein
VKIKTIPGGHLFIIIRQFIGPVAYYEFNLIVLVGSTIHGFNLAF